MGKGRLQSQLASQCYTQKQTETAVKGKLSWLRVQSEIFFPLNMIIWNDRLLCKNKRNQLKKKQHLSSLKISPWLKNNDGLVSV